MGDAAGLGRAIRRARLWRRLTQAQLADRVGVSRRQVARWEAGGVPMLRWARGFRRLADEPVEHRPQEVRIAAPPNDLAATRGVQD